MLPCPLFSCRYDVCILEFLSIFQNLWYRTKHIYFHSSFAYTQTNMVSAQRRSLSKKCRQIASYKPKLGLIVFWCIVLNSCVSLLQLLYFVHLNFIERHNPENLEFADQASGLCFLSHSIY